MLSGEAQDVFATVLYLQAMLIRPYYIFQIRVHNERRRLALRYPEI